MHTEVNSQGPVDPSHELTQGDVGVCAGLEWIQEARVGNLNVALDGRVRFPDLASDIVELLHGP